MTAPLTMEWSVQFRRQARGRRVVAPGQDDSQATLAPGRVPRVSRLMALALRFDDYLRTGVVAGQWELAELGHVTPARVSQVMNLLNLAPDIQEAILYLPRTVRGRDTVIMQQLQPIASTPHWTRQRRLWKDLVARIGSK